jgi:hypothetical protein
MLMQLVDGLVPRWAQYLVVAAVAAAGAGYAVRGHYLANEVKAERAAREALQAAVADEHTRAYAQGQADAKTTATHATTQAAVRTSVAAVRAEVDHATFTTPVAASCDDGLADPVWVRTYDAAAGAGAPNPAPAAGSVPGGPSGGAGTPP